MFIFVYSEDSLDWKDYRVDDIVNHVVESEKLNNGAVILMHNGAMDHSPVSTSTISGTFHSLLSRSSSAYAPQSHQIQETP